LPICDDMTGTADPDMGEIASGDTGEIVETVGVEAKLTDPITRFCDMPIATRSLSSKLAPVGIVAASAGRDAQSATPRKSRAGKRRVISSLVSGLSAWRSIVRSPAIGHES